MTLKKCCATVALLVSSLLYASPLRADGTLDYTYQANGNTFTWELAANPVLSSGNVIPGDLFTIPDLTYTENGASEVATLDFYNASAGGGFDLWIGDDFLINAYGGQLYSGLEGSPTMLTGTFPLSDLLNGCTPVDGTLTVTSVPEPSALLLLATGLLTIFGMVSLRKQ